MLLTANASGLIVTLCTSYLFITSFGVIGACYTASLAYFTQALVLTIVFMTQNNLKIKDMFSFKRERVLLK